MALLPGTAARAILHPLASGRAFGAGCGSSRRAWLSGALLCLQRAFWIPQALVTQHLIWRLKTAMETRNYLKYASSSFLGREEEKLASKKLLHVDNSTESRGPGFTSPCGRAEDTRQASGAAPKTLTALALDTLPPKTQSRHHMNPPGGVPPAATNFRD